MLIKQNNFVIKQEWCTYNGCYFYRVYKQVDNTTLTQKLNGRRSIAEERVAQFNDFDVAKQYVKNAIK